jgi:hypothetical protein
MLVPGKAEAAAPSDALPAASATVVNAHPMSKPPVFSTRPLSVYCECTPLTVALMIGSLPDCVQVRFQSAPPVPMSEPSMPPAVGSHTGFCCAAVWVNAISPPAGIVAGGL